jgi:hypothetical protein
MTERRSDGVAAEPMIGGVPADGGIGPELRHPMLGELVHPVVHGYLRRSLSPTQQLLSVHGSLNIYHSLNPERKWFVEPRMGSMAPAPGKSD